MSAIFTAILPVMISDVSKIDTSYGLAGWLGKDGYALLNQGSFHTKNAERINPEGVFTSRMARDAFGNWDFQYGGTGTTLCYAIMYTLGYSHIGYNGGYGTANLEFDAIRHNRNQRDTIDSVIAIADELRTARDSFAIKKQDNSMPYCSGYQRYQQQAEDIIFANRAIVLTTPAVVTPAVVTPIITKAQARAMWAGRAGSDQRGLKVEYSLDGDTLGQQVKRDVPALDMERIMARFRAR